MDSGSLPAAAAPGRYRRVCGAEQQPLFGPGGLDWQPRGGTRDKDKIEIQLDARRLVTHRRIAEAEHQRVMLVEHRPPRGQRDARPDPHPEEKWLLSEKCN